MAASTEFPIELKLAIFPASAFEGKSKKRLATPKAGTARGAKLAFTSTEPFDTLKAQILAKVDATIPVTAGQLLWERFEVAWTIRSIQPEPMQLRTEKHWDELLEELVKKPKAQVKLQVSQLGVSESGGVRGSTNSRLAGSCGH